MTDALRLSDLLTRRLFLQWHEGVAIVRGVTGQLLERHGAGLRVPELDQIELGADGSVAIAGGIVVNNPVRRLGQLLQATLTDAQVPVQLRLIVSQATAPIPSYPSLTEFDQAIAAFERPDRAGVLSTLFVRAAAAGRVTGADAAATLDRIAPLPENSATGLPTYASRKGARWLPGWAIAGIVVLALASTAALYAWRTGMKVEESTAARGTAVADAMGAAVLAGASAVSDSVGFGRIVPANAADPASIPEAPPPTPAERAMRPARAVAVSVKPVETGEISPLRFVVADEAADGRASVAETPALQTDTPQALADAPIDSVLYATGAAGVSSPIAVRPQIPQRLPPNVNPADLVEIELIIARDGSVESARLLNPRHHVLGGMFLSATKNWEFHPATRDGVPVRFRKTILVSFE